MDPFLSWFVVQALGPALVAQGLSLLGERDFRHSLARDAVAASGTAAPLRLVRRWLRRSETWSDLVEPSEAGVRRMCEALETTLHRSLRLRAVCRDADRRSNAATSVVKEVIAAFLQHVDPSTAIAIAHFREMKALAEVSALANRAADNTDALLQLERARTDTDTLLRTLPPPTRRILQNLLDTGSSDVLKLLDVLATPDDRARAAAELTRSPPEWLQALAPEALVAIAEYSACYEDRGTASGLFEQAANLGARDRPRLLARAAGLADDPAHATSLIDQAREVADGTTSFIDAQDAALLEDATALARCGDGIEVSRDSSLAILAVQGMAWEGDRDRAIEILREVREHDPDSSAARTLLARYLMERATEIEGPARDRELREAIEIALEARDLRREWLGDSAEPASLAIGGAAMIPDLPLVLRLGLTPPDGDAQDSEATAQEVLPPVALAASAGGLFDLAREVAGRIEDVFLRELTLGDVSAEEGDHEAAAVHLGTAWQGAETQAQQRQVQFGLAHIGHPELPDERDLAQRVDDPTAVWILAVAIWKRGNHEEAVRMVLPWRLRDQRCTNLLDEVLRDSGRDEESIQLLVDAARKWRSPEWLMRAVRLLAARGRLTEADELTAEALAASTSDDDRRVLLEVRIAAAQERLDWVAMERSIRDHLDVDASDPGVRWLLVGALYNQRRLPDAWAEIARHPPLAPTNEVQAVAWVDLTCRFSPGEQSATSAMDLHDAYPDSEDVHAAVVIGVMTMDSTESPTQATVDRFAAVRDEYLELYPNSDRVWKVDLGDSPERLVQALSQVLRPHAERFDELQREVEAGDLPSGVLSVGAGRPYALTFIARAAGCVPAVAARHGLRDLDRADALDAINGPVVAEASVLYLHALVPTMLPETLSALSSVRLGHSALGDLRRTLEHLTARTDGSLGWDLAAELPTFDERDPGAFAQAIGLARRMLETAESLALTPDPALADAEDPHDPRLLPWAGALELARESGLPLYSDDVGLRMLARNEGVPTFDTLSLLEALNGQGRLTGDLGQFRLDLHRHYIVDLDLDADLVRTLAEDEGWNAPSPASACFSRPAIWRDDPQVVLGLYLELTERCSETNRDRLPAWLFSAMVGVVGAANTPFHGSRLAADLLMRTAVVAEGEPTTFARLVAVAHEVARRTGIIDPVEPLIEALFTYVASHVEPAAAASFVIELGSELEGKDREVVRRVVFALGDDRQ